MIKSSQRVCGCALWPLQFLYKYILFYILQNCYLVITEDSKENREEKNRK